MVLASPGRDIRRAERPREQVTEPLWRRRRAPVHEEARAAVLHQQLPAAAAWRERAPVPGGHAHSDEPAVPASDQGRDEPAFGAEGEAKRGVFYVAPAHHGAVLAKPSRPYPQPRVRRVGTRRHCIGGTPEHVPVGNLAGARGR
jgi:hypothetical protein